LRPIARWVRQWLPMFADPSPIAHVDVATAQRTFSEVLGFAQSRTDDLFAHAGAARKWIFQARDFHLTTSQKKSGPGFLRGPILYRAGYIRPLPSWFHIMRMITAVKLPRAAESSARTVRALGG
jgi:hypothetical protein